MTDPLGLAVVTGSCSAVGIAELTLGGGYGPLIGRFGLALDNLIAADIILADRRIVTAEPGNEEDLFWAQRGGGGNFGVVAEMHIHLQCQTSSPACWSIASLKPERFFGALPNWRVRCPKR